MRPIRTQYSCFFHKEYSPVGVWRMQKCEPVIHLREQEILPNIQWIFYNAFFNLTNRFFHYIVEILIFHFSLGAKSYGILRELLARFKPARYRKIYGFRK